MIKTNKTIINIIDKMTLDQKVGAMLTLGFAGTVPGPHIYEYITKYHCGGLRLTPQSRNFGSYVNPKTGKSVLDVRSDRGFKKGVPAPYCTASQYKAVLDELQSVAKSRPLGLPLHFSFDQEGSDSANFCFGGVNYFPKPMGIRASGDSKYAYEIAKAVAKQSKAVGFSWIHSPVLDINTNPDNTEVCTRAYSDDAEVVAEYAEQTCLGYKEGKMITTGKHFPGRGSSNVDAHFEVPIIDLDRETIYNREILPYKKLIAKGILPSIMLAHTIYTALDPDNIATVSKKIVTGILREELGFEGVVTTDSMTMGGVVTRYGIANACAMSLEAGADLVLMKGENQLVEETFNTIKQYVEDGKITREELDNKVYRILNLKYEYGLFHISNASTDRPEDILNDKKIVNLSKEVALKSVLVARDRKGNLPLSKDERILIIEQFDSRKFVDLDSMSGMLYNNCLKYNKNVSYLETAYTFDEDDISRIEEKIKDFDTIVITNFVKRDRLGNTNMVRKIAQLKGKKVILITNAPYELTIPNEIDTAVVSFSHTIRHIEVTAGTLFGEILPQGEWPITRKLPE